ncbi:four helix bundle protein [Mucilaginibacter sp. OK283]|jgi:four helix bundle protein|uniref:four helix bundle protein n=1 Tax=Mucilaginibacter sp. OK283 TaxID=1881049 RepID=UPI0008BFFB1A|nr:four helix bundle protein [Mucilaginibacter sp. OK283]SEO69692.1 four helix bundle protein [Mucilaginibacter sp. OK283]
MAFKFENLQVWQKALELTDEINTLTKNNFPKEELFILTSQIKRAADSVVLNFAEGCTGQTNAVFSTFLGYSLRSAIEVVACLFIAKRRNIIKEDDFDKLYNEYQSLCKMITSLRKTL